jgi:hypothetical protein
MTWSKAEKEVARRAFEKAYERECAELLAKVRTMVAEAREPRDLWRIHDLLNDKRRATDHKYDYRYSVLILVFGRLLNEGWLTREDLEGLREDKLAKIEGLVQLTRKWGGEDEDRVDASSA